MPGSSIRIVSLTALCLNYTVLTILMHITRVYSDPTLPRYKASSAVLLTEMGKFMCSILLGFFEVRDSDRASEGYARIATIEEDKEEKAAGEEMSVPPRIGSKGLVHRLRRLVEETFAGQWYKLGVPAGLFTLQANLSYLAVANLSVPVFQCFAQLKILTTALCSVLLLKRMLNRLQWFSLAILAAGVALVQLDASEPTSHVDDFHRHMNQALGMTAVLASCMSSGFASIYFELQLKQPADANIRPTGLWVRNIQLSLFAMGCALFGFAIEARSEYASLSRLSDSFLAGFTPLVWLVVFLQILGGLLAALVIKYADNIAKNFSTSFSILLSFAASVALFNFRIGLGAVAGAAMLLASTWLFNVTPDQKEALAAVAMKTFLGKREQPTSSA